MSADTMDPELQAARIWADALTLLNRNSAVTVRQRSWLETVVPESAVGTTIILCVPSTTAMQVLQNDIPGPVVEALRIANGGTEMFPAYKTMPKEEPKEEPVPLPIDDTTVDDVASAAAKTRVMTAAEAVHKQYPEAVAQTLDDWYGEDLSPILTSTAVTMHSPAPAPTQGQLPIPDTAQTGDSPAPAHTSRTAVDYETHLNKNATFDTFVPGDSNRFARTVALAVAEGSTDDYNPLCIYGNSGLGKTHLLNAIGNHALVRNPNLKVRYVTSEEFLNEFIEALRTDKDNTKDAQVKDFNSRYRDLDVLLIDDVQFLGGKEETLKQFFNTFEALKRENKRIVIASDVPPQKLKGFEERLISRFSAGLPVDIQPPDLETRIAILRTKSQQSSVPIPNDVLDLIAERFTENIRELEGAMNRVVAVASLNQQPVTRALAQQTLQDFFAFDIEIKPADIIGHVARYFHLTFDDLVGRKRTKNIALARQIAMYMAREMTSMSLVDIGQIFGGRDHTTVMYACDRVAEEMQQKQEMYTYVAELTTRLKKQDD